MLVCDLCGYCVCPACWKWSWETQDDWEGCHACVVPPESEPTDPDSRGGDPRSARMSANHPGILFPTWVPSSTEPSANASGTSQEPEAEPSVMERVSLFGSIPPCLDSDVEEMIDPEPSRDQLVPSTGLSSGAQMSLTMNRFTVEDDDSRDASKTRRDSFVARWDQTVQTLKEQRGRGSCDPLPGEPPLRAGSSTDQPHGPASGRVMRCEYLSDSDGSEEEQSAAAGPARPVKTRVVVPGCQSAAAALDRPVKERVVVDYRPLNSMMLSGAQKTELDRSLQAMRSAQLEAGSLLHKFLRGDEGAGSRSPHSDTEAVERYELSSNDSNDYDPIPEELPCGCQCGCGDGPEPKMQRFQDLSECECGALVCVRCVKCLTPNVVCHTCDFMREFAEEGKFPEQPNLKKKSPYDTDLLEYDPEEFNCWGCGEDVHDPCLEGCPAKAAARAAVRWNVERRTRMRSLLGDPSDGRADADPTRDSPSAEAERNPTQKELDAQGLSTASGSGACRSPFAHPIVIGIGAVVSAIGLACAKDALKACWETIMNTAATPVKQKCFKCLDEKVRPLCFVCLAKCCGVKATVSGVTTTLAVDGGTAMTPESTPASSGSVMDNWSFHSSDFLEGFYSGGEPAGGLVMPNLSSSDDSAASVPAPRWPSWNVVVDTSEPCLGALPLEPGSAKRCPVCRRSWVAGDPSAPEEVCDLPSCSGCQLVSNTRHLGLCLACGENMEPTREVCESCGFRSGQTLPPATIPPELIPIFAQECRECGCKFEPSAMNCRNCGES